MQLVRARSVRAEGDAGSADGLSDADLKAELGAGPVVVVVPGPVTAGLRTPAGRRVVLCPAVARPGVTCQACALCYRKGRSAMVAFPVHGAGRSRMREQLVQLKLFHT